MKKNMSVTVRLFGAFRKFGNGRFLDVLVSEGVSVRDLRVILADEIGVLPGGEEGRALVFESALADEDHILEEGELVQAGQMLAILPPVCGG